MSEKFNSLIFERTSDLCRWAGINLYHKFMNMLRGRNTLKIITPPPYSGPELCFTANNANSTVQLTKTGTPTVVQLEINMGRTWEDYTIGDTISLSNVGDRVYMRNKSENTTGFGISSDDYYQFVMAGSISCSGNCNTLLCKNGTYVLSGGYCYRRLFRNCGALTSTPELPATTLTNNCYDSMFENCGMLTVAPELPAVTLADSCYHIMFQGCGRLTVPPELPAATLANGCYNGMFIYCTSLATPPELPATTLADNCYSMMFNQCSSLSTLPRLQAVALGYNCYQMMFNGCSKIKLSGTQTGEYQTPYRIPTGGSGSAPSYALNGMFSLTGGTFTGTPSINTTYYTSNTVI